MTTASIGHNSADLYVSDIGKLQAIDAVLKNPQFSQTEALILIGLIVRSDKGFENAFPGASTLAVYAKVNRTQTVFKALRALEEQFKVIERSSRGSGRSNNYTVIPQRVVDAIVEEFDARKKARDTTQTQAVERTGSPSTLNAPGTQATQAVERTATQAVERTTYPFLDPLPPQSARAKEPPTENKFVPVNWNTALNPYSAADAQDAFWVDGCKIEVVNGFKAELLRDFPNVNLIAGLSATAGEATPSVVGTELKRRIRRKFGYLQNDETGKDRRHARTVDATSARIAKAQKPKLSRW